MPFTIDPEIAAGLAVLFEGAEDQQPPAAGDVEGRRADVEALQTAVHSQLPMPDDVAISEVEVEAPDGAVVTVRCYWPTARPRRTRRPSPVRRSSTPTAAG